MAVFFAILGTLIIPAIIVVGLIKPQLYKTSRKKIILFGAVGIFISLIGLGLTAPEKTESEVLEEKKLVAQKEKVEKSGETEKVDEPKQNVKSEQKPTTLESEIEDKKEIEGKSSMNKEKDVKSSFKIECEDNSKKYPANVGSLLVTKGKYRFSGMKYYFVGELIEIGTLDGKSAWLVKNENGYVMPIFMDNVPEEVLGSKIEIWGTLTGEGYKLNVDNVAGQSGAMVMVQYSVNGEEKQ